MELLIAILATYMITIMLVETTGPFDIFYKIRKSNFMDRWGVLHCAMCTAMNVSLLTALYVSTEPLHWLMSALAIAGAVTIIDKVMEYRF